MSDPRNSASVFARMRATSNATLPFPITTAPGPWSAGAKSVKSGWPLYQPTNAADPITTGRSEERRVGKECVGTCRSGCAPKTHKKNKEYVKEYKNSEAHNQYN